MPGPTPKSSTTRQRRNKASTASRLLLDVPKVRAPQLPKGREWHPLTVAWWRDVWHSPMASEFLDSDKHGLYILADLVDCYWNNPSQSLAAEIRLQRQCYGLTPIDRRRLQWEVHFGADAKRDAPIRQNTEEPGGDPRVQWLRENAWVTKGE